MPKPALPASLIRAAVETRMGPVSGIEPLPEGLVSQVFGFARGGEAFVARVGRSRGGYEKDAFVGQTFARPRLPIPEVVAIEPLGDGLTLCISRRAAGVRLREMAPADVARLAPAILAVLDEIGRSNVQGLAGFGVFGADGHGDCRTWREHLLRFNAANRSAWSLALPPADAALVGGALAAIERLAPTGDRPRALVHGDFDAANLIAGDGAITAVIDWDRALIGDPDYDIANLVIWGDARLAPVCEALLARRAGDEGWRRTLLVYQLRIALEEIHDVVAGLVLMDLGWLLGRLRELMDEAAAL